MAAFRIKITLVNGDEVETKGFTRIHDGVLTVEPPYSRGAGPYQHWPLVQILTWTSQED
jgi:hypothetical protein